MDRPLRLLIVEDSEYDAELLLHAVRGGGYEVAYQVVDTALATRAALERQDWDVITSDHAMPSFSASAALELAKQLRPESPFIIVSGEMDLDLAVSLMKAGAEDYVRKGELARLVPVIERALREVTARRERQRAEEALEVSETRYRRLFETAQDGILILDADTGQIAAVNPFLTNLLGYPEAELLGKKLWEIGAFKDVEPARLAFAELQSEGYIRYEDLPLETSDGRHIATEFISNVYHVDHKKVIQCNIREITARKQAEADLRKLNADLEQRVHERTDQLEALNQELETFNYSVSHDLRAPLRHIDGFVEALREGYADKLDAAGLHLIQNIRVATQRMNALIEALLGLARCSRDELHRQPVDLSALARLIATDLQRSDGTRQVQFVIADGVTAIGDDRMLRIVLENLLSNAWKFSKQRAAACIEFGVAPQADGGTAYFVRDNGAGFDMAYTGRLFGAFQRLHSGKEFPGTGIGLATVQRIVHRHGGRVWAQAAVGEGATFYFTL